MTIAVFDPARALTRFVENGVNFVAVGGLAAIAWGADIRMMHVLEVCYERSMSNHLALLRALDGLEATLRDVSSEESSSVDIAMIETHDLLRLDTSAGAVDCVSTPAGTSGYSDLIRNATEASLGDGLTVRVSSLDDLLRIARAGGGWNDKADVEILSGLKEEREKR